MKPFCAVPLLAGAAVLVYHNSFSGAFQYDDYNVIVDNPAVHSWGAFLADLPRGIRPLLKFTYTLNWTSGLGLFGFHLVNVALHAGNGVLLFLLASRILGVAASPFPALLSALLFAVHPAQTEAVTYVSGRSVALMSFFYLASLIAYLRGRDRGDRVLLHAVSPALFLLSAASKEVALTLPFALLLCEAVCYGTSGWKTAIRTQAVHWAIFLFLAFLALAHGGYGRLLEACFDIRGVRSNLLTQLPGIAYLLSRLVMIRGLNIDPDLPVVSEWSAARLPDALLLAGLFSAGVVAFRRRSVAGFGVLWFFLHLVPTNSFIPRLDVANERQLYLSSWGLFLAAGTFLPPLRERWGNRHVAAMAVLLVVVLGGFTVERNTAYRTEVTLWEDTVKKSPRKARAWNNLGYAYQQAGRLPDAETSYRRALSIDPGFDLARGNLESLNRLRRENPAPLSVR